MDFAGPRRLYRMLRQQLHAVGQSVAQRRGGLRALQLYQTSGPAQLALRQRLNRIDVRAEQLEKPSRPLRSGFPVGDQWQRRALGDRAREQAVGDRGGQQRQHRRRTRRLPEHGHPVGIATERGDVVPHPIQRGDLIAQAQVVVESLTEVAEFETPEHADPVGDVDDDDVAVGGQPGAVVQLQLSGAVDEGAARNPHHHRQRTAGVRRPHRDCQAGLVTDLGVVAPAPDERSALRRKRSVLDGVTHPRPRLKRGRREEAAFADRLLGIGDAPPHPHAPFGGALQIAQ